MEDTTSLADLIALNPEYYSILAGSFAMPFGPFEGVQLSRIPLPYLKQLRDDMVLSGHPELRQAVGEWLAWALGMGS